MTTLFVNACVRGDQSRTLKLCRSYLDGIEDVKELDLSSMDLRPLTDGEVAYRSQLVLAEEFDDHIFDLAFQLAKADHVVIGAPYWDLSFPSVLKVYIERCSVDNVTFHYTERGEYEGRCNASEITYISTCGGFVDGADLGYEYICAIARMFGIPDVRYVVAEGMDILPADEVESRLAKAEKQLLELKENMRA